MKVPVRRASIKSTLFAGKPFWRAVIKTNQSGKAEGKELVKL
jgi:hypothetical protein